MKTCIVSSLDEETIQGEETILGRKIYEEIRYLVYKCSMLLQLAPGSRDLSQTENRITVIQS
jgi:hypothetical protein